LIILTSSSIAVARDAQKAIALSSAVSQDDNFIPEEYQAYFRTLVLQKQNRDDTAFSMFMHIHIVTEICNKLGIPCVPGQKITDQHLVGSRRLCISDIVQKLGHQKPGTFNNHRGCVHLARLCLDSLEAYGAEALETKLMRQVRELLDTPLSDAVKLKASRYGNMKDFNNNIKLIACQLGIKRKQADGVSSESE
jgi:hypothetical protein